MSSDEAVAEPTSQSCSWQWVDVDGPLLLGWFSHWMGRNYTSDAACCGRGSRPSHILRGAVTRNAVESSARLVHSHHLVGNVFLFPIFPPLGECTSYSPTKFRFPESVFEAFLKTFQKPFSKIAWGFSIEEYWSD